MGKATEAREITKATRAEEGTERVVEIEEEKNRGAEVAWRPPGRPEQSHRSCRGQAELQGAELSGKIREEQGVKWLSELLAQRSRRGTNAISKRARLQTRLLSDESWQVSHVCCENETEKRFFFFFFCLSSVSPPFLCIIYTNRKGV